MKNGMKIILIIVIGLIGLFLIFYLLTPINNIQNGIHIEFNNITNKYYVSHNEEDVFIFNQNIGSYFIKDNTGTFDFIYEEGMIKSDNYNFIVLSTDKLWFIEGREYLYEFN